MNILVLLHKYSQRSDVSLKMSFLLGETKTPLDHWKYAMNLFIIFINLIKIFKNKLF